MNKALEQKRKEAFKRFIEKNPDACSADYETWHQSWDELVKLFATPVMVRLQKEIDSRHNAIHTERFEDYKDLDKATYEYQSLITVKRILTE